MLACMDEEEGRVSDRGKITHFFTGLPKVGPSSVLRHILVLALYSFSLYYGSQQ